MEQNATNKKIPIWLIILIIAVFAALTVFVVVMIFNGSDTGSQKPSGTETTSETTSDTAEILYGYGSNEANVLSTYAVNAAEPYNADMSAVVAINDIGDACMNNGELQIYFWIEFYNFMNQYSYYASAMGLDSSVPLGEQASMMENYTWEQYFLESAAKFCKENYALAQAAYENGYVISEEDEANLMDMDDPNGNFAAEATEQGYESIDAYLQANFGKGVGVADYQSYLRTYYAAYYYYTEMQTETEASFSAEDVEKHFDENAETFAEQGLTEKVNNVSVRHLLISVEGDTDENGEYSEEAWAAAETAINEIYADWQTNPTEDYFIELAEANSTDPGSNTNGGLYEDVYPGQMVTEFNDWCFAADRAYGDHGIVKTPYGFHIMFFVGESDSSRWYDTALQDLVAVRMNEILDELVEKYPLKFDFTKVRIYDIIAENAATTETE